MKQKFTLQIADIQISVLTDATAEEVEHLSALLDRKMREIYLKSRCPKTEAALLCALEFAAERMNRQAEISELSDKCEKYTAALDTLKAQNAEKAAELERLRQENEILRSLVGNNAPASSPDPISPTEFLAEVADAHKTAAVQTTIDDFDTTEDEVESPRGRSRVGSMFDLLSFDETDD